MYWIPVKIHATHPKVLRLAELTGEEPLLVVGRMIEWFRHLDQNYTTGRTGIRAESLHRIIGCPRKGREGMDYAQAMQDPAVAWLSVEADGSLTAAEFDRNFGRCAKRRAVTAARVGRFRRNDHVTLPALPESSEHAPSVTQAALPIAYLQQQRQKQEAAADPPNPPEPAEPAPPPVVPSGGAAAAESSQGLAENPDAATLAISRALEGVGIGQPKRAELARRLAGLTPEIAVGLVRAAEQARRERGKSTGVLVREIEARADRAKFELAKAEAGRRNRAAADAQKRDAAERDAATRDRLIRQLERAEPDRRRQAFTQVLQDAPPVVARAWQGCDPATLGSCPTGLLVALAPHLAPSPAPGVAEPVGAVEGGAE